MNDTRFRSIQPENICDNLFTLIDKQWMLITAGNHESFNTMTASWGGFGILWNKPVVFCFVRPVRHTYLFMEKSDYFTLAFFSREYRDVLNYCGNYSGRDVDKIKSTGLTPANSPNGSVFFEESRLLFECRKLYFSDINPEHFILPEINRNYPEADYHRMYIGEITCCFSCENFE